MGRTKYAGSSSSQGNVSSSHQSSPGKSSNLSPAGKQTNVQQMATDIKIKDLLKDLHQLIHKVQVKEKKTNIFESFLCMI